MNWYPDKGLQRLIGQWREEHPGAVVGTIGDEHHRPPSGHLPEADGSVDAGDFMPGNGVTQEDLDELAEILRRNRDPRIAFVIRRQRIFSSTIRPWEWRPYSGDYHGHTHVEVNDRHENDTTRWKGIGMAISDDELDEFFTAVWTRKKISTGHPKPISRTPADWIKLLGHIEADVGKLLARPAPALVLTAEDRATIVAGVVDELRAELVDLLRGVRLDVVEPVAPAP